MPDDPHFLFHSVHLSRTSPVLVAYRPTYLRVRWSGLGEKHAKDLAVGIAEKTR
jgi:hypothetical protein